MLNFEKDGLFKNIYEQAKLKNSFLEHNTPHDFYQMCLLKNKFLDYSAIVCNILDSIEKGEISYMNFTGEITLCRNTHNNGIFVWDVKNLPKNIQRNYEKGLYNTVEGYIHLVDKEPITIKTFQKNVINYNLQQIDSPFLHVGYISISNIVIGLFELGLIKLFIGKDELDLILHSENLWYCG